MRVARLAADDRPLWPRTSVRDASPCRAGAPHRRHQSIAGKGHWHIARWPFFTLVTMELARLAKAYLRARSAPEPE